jgi:hypothetical protein
VLSNELCFTEPGRNVQSYGGFVGEDSHFHPHTAMCPMQSACYRLLITIAARDPGSGRTTVLPWR